MTWHVLGVPQMLPTAPSKWITESAHGQTGVPLPNTCQDLAPHASQSESAAQRHGHRRDCMKPWRPYDPRSTLLLNNIYISHMLQTVKDTTVFWTTGGISYQIINMQSKTSFHIMKKLRNCLSNVVSSCEVSTLESKVGLVWIRLTLGFSVAFLMKAMGLVCC